MKMQTLLNRRGNIPSFIHISDSTLGDVNVLDVLGLEAWAIYVRLYVLHQAHAFFVNRANVSARKFSFETVSD